MRLGRYYFTRTRWFQYCRYGCKEHRIGPLYLYSLCGSHLAYRKIIDLFNTSTYPTEPKRVPGGDQRL